MCIPQRNSGNRNFLNLNYFLSNLFSRSGLFSIQLGRVNGLPSDTNYLCVPAPVGCWRENDVNPPSQVIAAAKPSYSYPGTHIITIASNHDHDIDSLGELITTNHSRNRALSNDGLPQEEEVFPGVAQSRREASQHYLSNEHIIIHLCTLAIICDD
jgi:hypothetical protein